MAVFSKPKHGVFLTKARPFHRGHLSQVLIGAVLCNHVTVLISDKEDPFYPLANRVSDVKATIQAEMGRDAARVSVGYHIENQPESDYDEEGVITSLEAWKYWVKELSELIPGADALICSSAYGESLSMRMAWRWLRFDPDRQLYKISSSMIRSGMLANWGFLPAAVQQRFKKLIYLVGPESVGKSTQLFKIRDLLNKKVQIGFCQTVAETGRRVSEANNNQLTDKHFKTILSEHHRLTSASHQLSTLGAGVTLVDTDWFTTWKFAKVYGVAPPLTFNQAAQFSLPADRVFILQTGLFDPVQDGTRLTLDSLNRGLWNKELETFYKLSNTPYEYGPSAAELKKMNLSTSADDVAHVLSEMISAMFKWPDHLLLNDEAKARNRND